MGSGQPWTWNFLSHPLMIVQEEWKVSRLVPSIYHNHMADLTTPFKSDFSPSLFTLSLPLYLSLSSLSLHSILLFSLSLPFISSSIFFLSPLFVSLSLTFPSLSIFFLLFSIPVSFSLFPSHNLLFLSLFLEIFTFCKSVFNIFVSFSSQ